MYILVNSCAVNKALSVLSKYQKIIDSSSPKYYYYFVIYFVQTLYTIQNLLQMLLQIISKSTKKKIKRIISIMKVPRRNMPTKGFAS